MVVREVILVQAVWVCALDENNIVQYAYSEQCQHITNNHEELKAILHVMKLADENPDKNYVVYSDSMYAINSIQDWIYSWTRNDWKKSNGTPIENKDLMEEIYYKYLTKNFENFQLNRVRGHAGVLGNELADALASNNGRFTTMTDIVGRNYPS